MQDYVGRSRIIIRNGTNYSVLDEVDDVMQRVRSDEWVRCLSVTGQDAFPPEVLHLRSADVMSVQEITAESWIWQQRATELHYARQLLDLETAPHERLAAAQERLVEVLARDDDE